MRRVAVFMIFLLGLSEIMDGLGLLPPDEAWVIAGSLGMLVSYWVRPIPNQSYLRWIVSCSLLLWGAYLFLLKAPRFFAAALGFWLAAGFCFVLYFAFAFFLIRRRET
jgi:hypothetical protein